MRVLDGCVCLVLSEHQTGAKFVSCYWLIPAAKDHVAHVYLKAVTSRKLLMQNSSILIKMMMILMLVIIIVTMVMVILMMMIYNDGDHADDNGDDNDSTECMSHSPTWVFLDVFPGALPEGIPVLPDLQPKGRGEDLIIRKIF